jgi:hypothetical protein
LVAAFERLGARAAVDVGVVVLAGPGWTLGDAATDGVLFAVEHPGVPSVRTQATAAARKSRVAMEQRGNDIQASTSLYPVMASSQAQPVTNVPAVGSRSRENLWP